MKRLKVLLVSVVAICGVGIVAVAGANAGTGFVTIGGPPCDVTFSNTGGPTDPTPNSITINNLVEDTFDPDCAGLTIQNPATSATVNFAGNGTLTGSGLVRIRTSVSGIICFFQATSFTGTNTATTAVITGSFTRASGSAIVCPMTLPSGLISISSF